MGLNLVLNKDTINVTSAFYNPRLGIPLDHVNVIKYVSDLLLYVSAY